MMIADVLLGAAIVVLLALLILFASIQTFYQEGMRLRARDLPALQFFKTEYEPKLSLRSEVGAFTYSLCKHTCLVIVCILMLAKTVDGEPLTAGEVVESIVLAWAAMIFCT